MEKLHLAVLNTQPPLYLGGVERRILEIAKRLQNKVDTKVYSGTKAGLRNPISLNGLTVIPCFSTDAIFPLDNWAFNQTLARNAAAIKAQVYEAHTASAYALFSAFKKLNIKVPCVQTIHGVLADEYTQAYLRGNLSLRGKLANLLMWQLAKKEEQSAKLATLVVTISKYSEAKIKQFYDIDNKKMRIVPNGVDSDRFKPGNGSEKMQRKLGISNKQSVLFVGRLIPRKGISFFIEAAKEIIKEKRETKFVIIGNGPLRNYLNSEIKKYHMTNNFPFIGDVSEDDLSEIYRCTDVFAFPSIQEGQGIVLLEAQSTGKPVVAFNVSGVAEAARNGETGLLVKPNSNDLANAILRLLSDSSLRRKMGDNGRKFVQNEFTWDICAQKMLNVYQEALSIT